MKRRCYLEVGEGGALGKPGRAEQRADDAPIWERMPGEPNVWYQRFVVYRELGAGRTVRELFIRHQEARGLRRDRVHGSWYAASSRWRWRERADAWERAEREKQRALEEERRVQARRRRMDMIDVLLGAVYQAMRAAKLDGMDSDEARRWLPTMRMLLKDLMQAQRAEVGMPAEAEMGEEQAPPFMADELVAAQRELEAWLAHEESDGADVSHR